MRQQLVRNCARLALVFLGPLVAGNAPAVSVSYDYGVASSMAKVIVPGDPTEHVVSGSSGGDGITPFAYASTASMSLDPAANAFAQVSATGTNELDTLGPFTFTSLSQARGTCGAGCSQAQMNAPAQHLTEFHTDADYTFSASYTWLAEWQGAVTLPNPNFLLDLYDIDTLTSYIALSASTSDSGFFSGYLPAGNYLLKAGTTNFLFVYDNTEGARSTAATFDLTLTPVTVPLPGAAWLLLSGLGTLGAIARRRRLNVLVA